MPRAVFARLSGDGGVIHHRGDRRSGPQQHAHYNYHLGAGVYVDPGTDRRASRTRVVLGDIAVASASGCAGVLALTTGVSAALALLLPLVTFGLLLGGGQPGLAMSALALLLMNLVCMNLADVTTFLVQHIPPSTWRGRDRAAQQISRNAKPAV